MLGVQIIAAQPPHPGLGFDLHQFDRRSKAVSATSRLSFADFGSMHVERRAAQRCKRWIPAFSKSDRQLRRVLAVGAWQYVNGGRVPVPDGLENNLAELKRITNQKFEKWTSRSLDGLSAVEQRMLQTHIYCTERAGGWLQLHATVVWLSWRLGYTSPQVATELWISAPCVRLLLYRMTRIARALGYETFRSGKWMGKFNIRQPHMVRLPPGPELIRLHSKAYWTDGRLAKRFRVKRSTVQSAIRNARKKARGLS
jgi:hypothetical protein